MDNTNSQTMPRRKLRLYNPNRFNGLDGAICFLLTLVAFTVIPYVIKYLMGDTLKALSKFDTYAYSVVSILISQSIIFLVAFLYSLVRRANPFSGGGYKASWDGVHVLMSTMLILGIMMLFYFTHLQFANYASNLVPVGNNVDLVLSPYSGLFIVIYYLEIAILPAFIEEMLFRGIIMRGFEQFGGLFAVICSATAFSLMHGNFGQLILQFIGGLAIGGVVYITKNYLLGVIMHFVNNSFSVVYTLLITPLFEGPISTKITAVTGAATILLGVAFCLVSGIYFISMLFEKEKNKALCKSVDNKYEKKRYYLMQAYGREQYVAHNFVPKLYKKQDIDVRLFVIRGQYRELNRASDSKTTFIMTGISIILAIVLLFLG